MSINDIVSKFNRQADSHSKSQSLNPFSEQFEQSRSPSPRFSREEYGKPVAGSKTDLRGRKAKKHICREILELCTVIHDVGTYNTKKRVPDDDDDDDEIDDGTIIVSFGELFQIYTKISDKVVGLLIAAKRRGFVYFDREILFQRRDDDVLIALLKPMSEISKILNEDINQANSFATTPVEPKPVEKKKSPSSSKTKRVKPACSADDQLEQNESSATAAVDQPDKQASPEVANGSAIVPAVEMAVDRKPDCDLLTNGETVDDGDTVVGCQNADDNANCNGNNDDNNIIANGEELLVSNVVEISENMYHDQTCRSEDNNIVSEEKEEDSIVVDAETTETGHGCTGEAAAAVVAENKNEIGCDSLAADGGVQVRPEMEINVRDETRVQINKTARTDDDGRVEDVTEESANVVDNGSEKNDNNIL